MNSEQVMHKERGEKEETSPLHPPKGEKGEKEILPSPSPFHHAGAGAREGARGEGKGKVDFRQSDSSVAIPLRRGVALRVDDETIRYSETDSVVLALAALRLPRIAEYRGRTYNNARLLRKVLHQIGDEVFREVLIQQLHENDCDGEPRSRAAAFMAKLYAVRDEMLKGGKETA